MEETEKKIKWAFQALEHVYSIDEYISIYDELTAEKFVTDLFGSVNEKLAKFPERNPPCAFKKLRNAGYRCMKFRKKYIVVYKEYEDCIEIIAVMFSGRNPQAFEDLI